MAAASASPPARAADRPLGCRVFLTFDVETDDDIEALRKLDPPGACTLFVTGKFAVAHPEAVREWAVRHEIACHTMNHPRLIDLDFDQQLAEIRDCAAILERLTGSRCQGFRAPYLLSNDDTREVLVQLGFRYHSTHWEEEYDKIATSAELLDLPVAGHASDHNLFVERKLGESDVLRYLYSLYAERSLSGRPLVILLHPHVIAAHADMLRQFIEHVGTEREHWGCLRDWLDETSARRPQRRALWVDTRAIPYEAREIVAGAKGIGITDLFVQAYDPDQGPIFGLGKPHDDYFNGMIDEGNSANIRVHAWFPTCFDRDRLRRHPEWGMMDSNGTRSEEWVCPTTVPWRAELTATIKSLLDSYGVDGIHLDSLRFPNAEVCQCPQCRATVSRRAQINWPLGLELSRNPDLQKIWWDYRVELIRELTESLSRRIHEIEGQQQVSASFKVEGALNADGARVYGQSYERLAPLLDFITPLAHHQVADQSFEWVKAIEIAGQWRAGATPLWIGVQAYQEPGRPPMELAEFGSLLESVRKGSTGVALYSYAPLFSVATEEDSRFNMPYGSAALVGKWARGIPVGSLEAVSVNADYGGTSDVESHGRTMPGRWTGATYLWALAGGGLVLAVQWLAGAFRRLKQQPHTTALPLPVLKTLANEPLLTGAQAEFISERLRLLKPADLERIRNDALLLSITDRGGEAPLRSGSAAETMTIESALASGLIEKLAGGWRLAASGLARLRDVRSDRDLLDCVQFVENRLNETLEVECPHCHTNQPGHWMRATLGCPTCHHRFPLRDSPAVVPSRTAAQSSPVSYIERGENQERWRHGDGDKQTKSGGSAVVLPS
jgi:peptidoglycan/xylan/chitin deacetylase (PgdA/CDA1 family)